MAQDKVVHSMAKFDFHTPTNVKIIIEDCSDEDTQEACINDVLRLGSDEKQNKELSDNNANVDGFTLKHVKVNESENFTISSVVLTNSTEVRNNNLLDINTRHTKENKDEKSNINGDDLKNTWCSIEELLMTASKHFIIIIKSYNEYLKVKSNRECHSKAVMNARNKYLYMKHLTFKIIYHVIISVLLPEEKNSQFIKDFINSTLKIAKKIPENPCTYSQLEIIYCEFLEWAKQKEISEGNKRKNINVQNDIQVTLESNSPSLNFNREFNPNISSPSERKTYENNILASESLYKEFSPNTVSVLHNNENLKARNSGTSTNIREMITVVPLSKIFDTDSRIPNYADSNKSTNCITNNVGSHSASQTFTHKGILSTDKSKHIIVSKEGIQSNNDHINHQLSVNSSFFALERNNTTCQNIAAKGIEQNMYYQNTQSESVVNIPLEQRDHAQQHEINSANRPQQINIHSNTKPSNVYQLYHPPSAVPVPLQKEQFYQLTHSPSTVPVQLQKEVSNSCSNRYNNRNLCQIYNNSNQYPPTSETACLNTKTISTEHQLQYAYPELTRHIQSNAINYEDPFRLPGSLSMTAHNYNNIINYNNQSISQAIESHKNQHRNERRNLIQPYSHRPPWTEKQHIVQSVAPPSYVDYLKNKAAANIQAAVVHLGPPNNVTMELPTVQQTPLYEYDVRNENGGSIVVDRTRSTASTDSGFVSPLNTTTISENFNDTPTESCGPLITHVTSLNPNAAQNCMGLCHVCRKETKTKCLGCYNVYYCGVVCQNTDWHNHMQRCEYVKLSTK